MSETLLERSKKVAQRVFYELVNDRDYSVIPQIFSPDVEIRFGIKGLAGVGLDGIEGVHKWLRHFHDAFSDCRDELLGQWAEGDVVVICLFNSASRPSWSASSTSVCRNRQIDMWSGVFWSSGKRRKRRNDSRSATASSAAGSDRPYHCCKSEILNIAIGG